MFRATFQENPLFHFEPSQVSFKGMLSSMLSLLQARQAFIFQERRPGQNQERLLNKERLVNKERPLNKERLLSKERLLNKRFCPLFRREIVPC